MKILKKTLNTMIHTFGFTAVKITALFSGVMIGSFLLMSNVAIAAVTDTVLSASSRDALVLFYTSSCAHCQRFAPVLKQYADAQHWPVLAYTLDGVVLPSFPDSIKPTLEEARHFFPYQAPVVPVVFWVDAEHQRIVPVLQGEASLAQLTLRMQRIRNPAFAGGHSSAGGHV